VSYDPRHLRLRLALWLLFVLTLAALNYADRFAGGTAPKDLAYRWSSSIGAAIQYGVMLGLLLLIAIGLPKRELFALRRPRSWPRALGLAFAALVAVYVVGGVLSPFLNANKEQGFLPKGWDSSRAAAFVAFFVAVTVLAPMVEELTFRGLGFGLLAPHGTWTAIVTTGVLFGLAHGLVVGLPILAVFGLMLGWLRTATTSVYPGMLLHGTFNAIALILSVTALNWWSLRGPEVPSAFERASLTTPARRPPRRPRAPRGSTRTPPGSPSRGTYGTPPDPGRRDSRP
jgi:membrane protease YdiL (CAAX protease family)